MHYHSTSTRLVHKLTTVLLVLSLLPHCLDIGQGEVDLEVLQFVVLVEAALTAIWLATGLDGALVVSLNLIRIPPHALALLLGALALTGELIVLVLAESRCELSLFLEELLDLVGECDVGEEETAVFVVIAFLLCGVAG
jgi:hypothetical protein